MKRFFTILAVVAVAFTAATAQASLPTEILGPGLNSGRTDYFQSWDRTLSADTVYVLTGLYYVDSLRTLTIPAGTVVLGDTAATLIVRRGGKIYSMGEQFNPVVFSSLKAPGSRAPGDWGGVVVLGRAPGFKTNPLIEGGIIFGSYGGNVTNDNSGVIKYTRIEFCGYRFQLDNEINGLTCGGVGSGTEIHHVQVSYSFDDSYEWFGGAGSRHHLVAYGGTDDDWDIDEGFIGTMQFLFSLRDEFYSDPAGQSNGIETDGDIGGKTPVTRAILCNMTAVGPERTNALVPFPLGQTFEYSGVFRECVQTNLFNSVIMGFPWGLSIRDACTHTWATDDTLRIRNTSIQSTLKPAGSSSVHDEVRWASVTSWFNTAGYNNIGSAQRNPDDIMLTDMSILTNPNPVPAAGSELIGSADFSDPHLAGLEVTTYRGAFDPDVPMYAQWTRGWTNFDPQNTPYDCGNVVSSASETPVEGMLLRNFPNPFNPSTTVEYTVPTTGAVELTVYNARGELVQTLVHGVKEAGTYTAHFNATGLASGVYFYRLKGRDFVESAKMVLMK